MTWMESLPEGSELVRTTATFDETSVPGGLLRRHRVADQVWGRLVVASGALRFIFDDTTGVASGEGRLVRSGESQVIPPSVVHHVELIGPVEFVVEFYSVGNTVGP
jgi:tellurite resistance-related uncharacterized protein